MTKQKTLQPIHYRIMRAMFKDKPMSARAIALRDKSLPSARNMVGYLKTLREAGMIHVDATRKGDVTHLYTRSIDVPEEPQGQRDKIAGIDVKRVTVNVATTPMADSPMKTQITLPCGPWEKSA